MSTDCSSCGKSLANSYYFPKDGHSYCTSCYDIRFSPTCKKCHEKIKNDQKKSKQIKMLKIFKKVKNHKKSPNIKNQIQNGKNVKISKIKLKMAKISKF